ncbi:hypothetical protein Tco_0238476 [Tanacetum coccineum]
MNMVITEKQSSVSCKGISSEEALILKKSFAPLHDRCTQNIHCPMRNQEHDNLPDGCQNAFLNGDLQEGSLCQSSWKDLKTRKSPYSLYRLKNALNG